MTVALVETVAGPVDADELGVTYMHEHVFLADRTLAWHWPGVTGWDEERELERARGHLRRLKEELGCDTIVDPTVPGLGRNVRAVARAAEGTGLRVVVATGWYLYRELPFAFHALDHERRIATLLELFLADVRDGIEGTAIKPGILKCATDRHGVTADVEAVLRACARAHRATGLPITTHSGTLPVAGAPDDATRSGLAQQRIFAEEGVDLASVVIGHCNQQPDLALLEELLRNGSSIGFDRLGIEEGRGPAYAGVPSREQQLDHLATLVERGYASQIVLSHDNWSFLDFYAPDFLARQRGAEFPYGHVHDTVLPGLRARGVADADLQQMLVATPRRLLARPRSDP